MTRGFYLNIVSYFPELFHNQLTGPFFLLNMLRHLVHAAQHAAPRGVVLGMGDIVAPCSVLIQKLDSFTYVGELINFIKSRPVHMCGQNPPS